MDDVNFYPAPDALVAHCRRMHRTSVATIATGDYDVGDVAALVRWLHERGEFESHDPWVSVGMALRLALGDAGRDIWELTRTDATDDTIDSKWKSFATETKPGCVTLASIMKRAHVLGWGGSIRPATASMFDGVAQLAANASATLPRGAVPIVFGRGQAHVRIFSPLLEAVPILPRTAEHPELPDIGHPLRDAINAAIPGIVANPSEHVTALAVINLLHPQTAAKIWPITPLVNARTAALEAEEKQALAPNDWARDQRTQRIENDNIDNVEFYLNSLGIEWRWNAWFERAEIKGWKWSRWSRVDDTLIAMLRMHGTKTGTRLVMGKEFAADALLTLSQRNVVDPACDLLDKLQAEWDGVARIDTWLCRACGVPDNAYYRAVSRTVLSGLVGRIRHPGIKFDLMMVLISPKQGTEKSSLAKALALDNAWFIENVRLDMEPKELVLLLAGKTVAEVTEMRNRGDAEAAKAMITTTHDEGRTAYGRFTTVRARRNILIGSTNKPEFFEDTTGGRRFLPISVTGMIDIVWVKATLAQLIGEAAAGLAVEVAKHDGEKIELPPEVWAIAAEYQEAARAVSDFEIHLAGWFAEGGSGYIAAHDLAALLKDATGRSVPPNQCGKTMQRLGFTNTTKRIEGVPKAVWHRGVDGVRITVQRDPNGRMSPRQMFGAVVSLAQGARA